jgi:regulatory protein
LARTLRGRGLGRKGIIDRLRARGIEAKQAALALEGVDADGATDAELGAAEALVRRRRLGPWRPEEQRARYRRRDLAVLARAGFNLDVALRALRASGEEGEF